MKFKTRTFTVLKGCATPLLGFVLGLNMIPELLGSENVPHPRFGEWAEVPSPCQLIAGVVYEESEA